MSDAPLFLGALLRAVASTAGDPVFTTSSIWAPTMFDALVRLIEMSSFSACSTRTDRLLI
jgi:hypothetical protein